jgi:hypothetical protein
VIDSGALVGVSNVISVSTDWVPPAAPDDVAVDTIPYNTENQGYVAITWGDVTRDPDFQYWIVSRKDDLIDQLGVVVEEGSWEEVGRIYVSSDVYQYNDYYAPSGYLTTYKVSQVVNRFNDVVPSEDDVEIAAYPQSDGYWLIEPETVDADASAFKLSIVNSDEFTDEYDEEEYNLIGRGRHVDRGDHLGVKGSLGVQIRDSASATARQKKLRLDQIKAENRSLFLRNPFGDIFSVYVSSLGISRVAGVGTSEFVDVTIPYSELDAAQ